MAPINPRKNFQSILNQLNTAQRAAVEQIEGPVLVIAGPGTGKTHILAARIGKILLDTDTSPSSILCLTYTDAGVQAMRQRLLDFIGPDAHRVNIHTFHSFCNRVIQENLDYFGQQGLEPISELERIEVIRKILLQLPVSHPLRLGKSNPYFYEAHLLHLFRTMKMERWSAKAIQTKIDTYLEDIPNRPEFIYQVNRGKIKKGSPKLAKIEDQQERMNKLGAAADLFKYYHQELSSIRRYDYEDMILWVNQAFSQNEVLLRRYQEQYLYLLVDEFQDTNGAQNKLIQQLVDYWDNPNLFIVGDDDQAIYEFQGARLQNITEYFHKYKQFLQMVILRENYRSTQAILDRSNQLIRNNEKRILTALKELDIQKQLVAANPEVSQLKTLPKLHSFPNRFQENVAILQEVQQLQSRGYALNKIAIIYALHRQANGLLELFEKKGIPFNARRAVNILDLILIRQIRQILEFVALELEKPGRGEHLVYKLLHFKFFNIDRKDVEQLNWRISSQETTWREALQNEQLLIGLATGEQIKLLGKLLLDWLEFASNHSTVLLIEQIMNTSGILKSVIHLPDKAYWVQVLDSFMTFVKQENTRRPRLQPAGLLETFNKLDENRIGISLNKVTAVENGVHFITAHSAKGLEFEKVFLLGATKEFWEPRNRSGAFRFILPDTLTFANETDELEARRRLFYVAMTRAKKDLTISYSRADEKDRPLERCIYVDELSQNSAIEEINLEINSTILTEIQEISLKHAELPRVQLINPYWITELLKDFRLSASSFNTYLKCPLSFYYEYVLRVPMISSEAASYGTAVHNALENLFKKVSFSPRSRLPAKSTFLRFFRSEMESLRGNFSFPSWNRYLEQGKQNLGHLYDRKINTWHRKVRVELPIRNVTSDGVPLKGTIDKIEFLKDNQVHIVDYKTGTQDPAKIRMPTKARPHGGSYWRQLIFYKILYENFDRLGRVVQEAKIVYIEPDSKGKYLERAISPKLEEVQLVKDLLKETYLKITNHEFDQGCGKSDCHWCRFVINNELVYSFAEANDLIDDKYF